MTRYEMGSCPACGRDEHRLIADAAAIRDELEQLWAFHTRRLRGDTPPERLRDRIAFSQDPPLRLVRCTSCDVLYRNPREKQEELVGLYREEKPEPAALRALFDNQAASYRTQARRLAAIAGERGTGLEVGSYVGAFLAAARDGGWTFSGVDVNPGACAFARSLGFPVCEGMIDDTEPGTDLDVVAFWNCFDQLPDPRAAAAAARRRVRVGGWIAVRVPSGDFYARWRRRLHSPAAPLTRALLAHNNLLGFPYRHGFSIRSLTTLLERAGFRAEHAFGDSLVPVADRWTRPWAHLEEAALKTILRPLPATRSPWLEMYARAV